jgi:hypothetical protein
LQRAGSWDAQARAAVGARSRRRRTLKSRMLYECMITVKSKNRASAHGYGRRSRATPRAQGRPERVLTGTAGQGCTPPAYTGPMAALRAWISSRLPPSSSSASRANPSQVHSGNPTARGSSPTSHGGQDGGGGRTAGKAALMLLPQPAVGCLPPHPVQ